jgi:hypothetical protein
MFSKPFKRLLLIGVTALALVLAIAPASFAGEDGGDTTTTTDTTPAPAPAPAPAPQQSSGGSSSGSSDHKVAKGGVQTGFGGMASASDANVMLPVSIGGALILLSSVGAGGLAFRRR